MYLGFRLLLGYFLIVGLAAWLVLDVFVDEVKPGVRQAMEDNLVDTANLLAEIAVDDLRAGRLADGDFQRHWRAYRARDLNASVWGFDKRTPGLRVYITDARGKVVFDSEGRALGKDYSRWNDVYLTLRGEYGVRTSPEVTGEQGHTVMHVAAPILHQGQTLGVLTVARSNQTVQPFIERSEEKIRRAGVWLLLGSLLIGALAVSWLVWSMRRLSAYADAVSRGERVSLPQFSSSELQNLAGALESMRTRLEGKHYVENYVTTLTHEMKSPLAAIQGAAELLDEDLPPGQRQRFAANIREQAARLYVFIEKMLQLAAVEQRQQLDQAEVLELGPLLQQWHAQLLPQAEQRGLQLQLQLPADTCRVRGDPFLLRQAVLNVLDNALDFSPAGGVVQVSLQAGAGQACLRVRDQGEGVPDYALPHVFDRFYSLARPASARRSSGIGLNFVREVMSLHGGSAELRNHPDGGAEASLCLPLLV